MHIRTLLLTLLSFCLLGPASLLAQSLDLSGAWKGYIETPSPRLEIQIELQKLDDGYKGRLDIPVQGIADMPLDELAVVGDSLFFRLTQVPGNAHFSGHASADGLRIRGTFSQGGFDMPMVLERPDALTGRKEAERVEEALAFIRHFADSVRAARAVPGLAVAIWYRGQPVLVEGFGYTDPNQSRKVDGETLFAIGSCTKAFTAADLALLADDGLLEWDRPLREYLPDFRLNDPFATAEMRPRDLLVHNSGLPRHDLLWYATSYTREMLYQRLRYLEPSASFRSKWQYNNLMYMTAGILVERLSGQSWEDFNRTRLLAPLGMQHTNVSGAEMLAEANRALPCTRRDDHVEVVPFHNIDAVGPAGSINSCASDMVRWMGMLLQKGEWEGQRILSEDQIKELFTARMVVDGLPSTQAPEIGPANYALGWITYNYRDLWVASHGGNIDGYTTQVLLVPRKELGIVVLANLSGTSVPNVVARTAADHLLGLEPIDWYARAGGNEDDEEEEDESEEKQVPHRVEGTQPGHPLADYAGTYAHPAYGEIEVQANGEGLKAHFHDFELPLEHWHYDVFMARDTSQEIELLCTFHTDKEGRVAHISIPLEPMVADIVFERQAPDTMRDPEVLDRLVGKYVVEGVQPLEISRKGNRLYASLPGQPTYTLAPRDAWWFDLAELNGFSMKFVLDEAGKVKEVIICQPNGTFRAQPKE